MIKTQTASCHVWAESAIQWITGGDTGGEELIFSVVFTCHSVCRWNCCRWIRRGCGCPWNRPNLFASDFPHVRWSWLSSQCWLRWCERKRGRKDTSTGCRTLNNLLQETVCGSWWRENVFIPGFNCVFSILALRTTPPLQSCANLHFSCADSPPVHNNEKAPSAVYWPVGLVT